MCVPYHGFVSLVLSKCGPGCVCVAKQQTDQLHVQLHVQMNTQINDKSVIVKLCELMTLRFMRNKGWP